MTTTPEKSTPLQRPPDDEPLPQALESLIAIANRMKDAGLSKEEIKEALKAALKAHKAKRSQTPRP